MVAVHLYVEGGGNSRSLRIACRRGFRKFFEKAGLVGAMPRIFARGSRRAAYEAFCTASSQPGDVCAFLLVNSEDAVADEDGPWDHLRKRDLWARPEAASDGQCHLMVQIMESWFLADKATLARYFGKGFKEGALPKREDVEAIPKADVLKGLRDATRHTETKGSYSKGSHSFQILALIDPNLVRTASPYADRLLVALANPEAIC